MPGSDSDEVFGEVISRYSEDDAIADGQLIHPYPKQWPWLLITPAIHAACSKGDGRTYDQCLKPLLMDCIMEAQKHQQKARRTGNGIKFPLVLEGTIARTVWIEPNSKGGMTVMTPSER